MRRMGKAVTLLLSLPLLTVGLASSPAYATADDGAMPQATEMVAPGDGDTGGAPEIPTTDSQTPETPADDPAPTDNPANTEPQVGDAIVLPPAETLGNASTETPSPLPVTMPAFSQTQVADGVGVTVTAPEGTFPAGATLSVRKAQLAERVKVDVAVGSERSCNAKVAERHTLDVKVIGTDGIELQPANGHTVQISFATDGVADANLSTDVYHMRERAGRLLAQRLGVTERGRIATAVTDGFSYYQVEFTYDERQYILPGDSSTKLSEILAEVGLTGDVTAVEVSDESKFSASKETGEWFVTAHKAFDTQEWMRVTIDGRPYEIVVTDGFFAGIAETGSANWRGLIWDSSEVTTSTAKEILELIGIGNIDATPEPTFMGFEDWHMDSYGTPSDLLISDDKQGITIGMSWGKLTIRYYQGGTENAQNVTIDTYETSDFRMTVGDSTSSSQLMTDLKLDEGHQIVGIYLYGAFGNEDGTLSIDPGSGSVTAAKVGRVCLCITWELAGGSWGNAFVNVFVHPQAGSLKIRKNVTVNGSAATTTQADGTYTFHITDDQGQSVTDANGNAVGDQTITITNGASGEIQIDDLAPGTYIVTEDTSALPAGMDVPAADAASQTVIVTNKNADGIPVAEFTNNMTVTDEPAEVANEPTETPAKAILTFDLDGGELDGKTGKVTMDATVGETVRLLGAPTRKGYVFKCWKGSEYTAGAEYKVEGDHTFVAQWEKEATKDILPQTGDAVVPVAGTLIVAGAVAAEVARRMRHQG